MKRIAVINGPNLNILGKREVEIYGTEDLNSIENKVRKLCEKFDINVLCFRSNHEGEIVDFIQQHMFKLDGILINPAAFTKTGYSILDALNAKPIPFIEIHLSNIMARSGWHSESIFSSYSKGIIVGFNGYGYELGVYAINNYLEKIKN